MNPLDGLRLYAVHDPYAVGFTPSQLRDAMYYLTADPAQEELLLETETFSVMDSALIVGEPILSRANNFILDALATSYARFPRVMKFLERSLNTAISNEGINVIGHEIGPPKKNNLFATVAVSFSLSDGQSITVVFHAPDEDPKVFKADDMVIAFRWLLNKRDVTHVVAPEMSGGKMKDISIAVIGKRIGQLVKANSQSFTEKQDHVNSQRKELSQVQAETTELASQVEQLNHDIANIEEIFEDVTAKNLTMQEQLDIQINHNNELRAKIAAFGATATTTTTATERESGTRQDAIEYENNNPNVNAYISSLATTQANKDKARASLESYRSLGSSFGIFVNFAGSKAAIITEMAEKGFYYDVSLGKGKKTRYRTTNSSNSVYIDNFSKIELDFAKWLGMQEYKPEENYATPTPTNEPPAVKTLQDIIEGLHDDVKSEDVLEMIEQALADLEAVGLAEQYDALLGAAAEKFVELDEAQNG